MNFGVQLLSVQALDTLKNHSSCKKYFLGFTEYRLIHQLTHTVIISLDLWGTAGRNFLLMLVVTTLVDIMASTSRRMEVYLHTCHQHDYLEGEGNEWHLWPGSSSTE